MMKKLIPIFLIVLLFCQSTAWAATADLNALVERHMTDLVDMERVFQYDYMRREQQGATGENTEETLEYHNAVHLVLALGLMDTLPGGVFGEQEAVPYGDFAKIVYQLNTGSSENIEEKYELYPDNQYATFNDAVYYLVGAMGYDAYESIQKGDNPRTQIALNIGLLDGLTFVGEKNITRGELAKMLYNALGTDMVVQTVFGAVEEYDVADGKTLLTERFDAALVYGTVTAQNGLNLYVEEPLEEDTISIDRVAYDLNGMQVEDVLGYQVQAVVRMNQEENTLLGITIDERDETIALPLDDSVYADSKYIYYMSGEQEERQKISDLDRVMVNDELVSADELAKLIGTTEGEIRFSKTARRGNYTLAVVRSWSSYIVKSVSTLENKIYLDNEATFKGSSFIDVGRRKQVFVQKGDQAIPYADITAGSAIDVIESRAGDAVTILVSGNTVSGSITRCEDNTIYIDGKAYPLSQSYLAAREKDPTLPALEPGKNGSFLLNASGRIVSFTSQESAYKLGLLTELGRMGSGLNTSVAIKTFTEDNEWKELYFAEKITLDGIGGVKALDAFTALDGARETICYAPVRFILDNEGKIRSLDTAIVNDVEKYDTDSIIKAADYSGEINWTSGSKAEWSGLTDSKYFYTQTTKFITIPSDRTREQDYAISTTSYLSDGMNVNMELYNADDFFGVDIIVRTGSTTKVIAFENNYSWLVFMGLSQAVDEEGEPITILHGYDGSAGRFELNEFRLEETSLIQQAQTFSNGDLVHFSADGKKMLQMELWCAFEDIGTDKTDDPDTQALEGLGTVVDVDPSRKVVKVNVAGHETTWRLHCLGLYDSEDNKGIEIQPGDILPGDRAFGLGGFNYMRTLIIR